MAKKKKQQDAVPETEPAVSLTGDQASPEVESPEPKPESKELPAKTTPPKPKDADKTPKKVMAIVRRVGTVSVKGGHFHVLEVAPQSPSGAGLLKVVGNAKQGDLVSVTVEVEKPA